MVDVFFLVFEGQVWMDDKMMVNLVWLEDYDLMFFQGVVFVFVCGLIGGIIGFV